MVLSASLSKKENGHEDIVLIAILVDITTPASAWDGKGLFAQLERNLPYPFGELP